jgi:hypothetical protein
VTGLGCAGLDGDDDRCPPRGVARIRGEISAHATRRGRPRPQNDTWIAADCLAYNLPLATLNTTDFSDIVEHEVLVLV